MIAIREISKTIFSYIPSHLYETGANYAAIREQKDFIPDITFDDRTDYHRSVSDYLGSQTPLNFLEFGVYRGGSLKNWTSFNKNPNSRFYGFDSFEGLPEAWRSRPKGHFNLDGKMPVIDDKRVKLIKGWFNETLPEFLEYHDIQQPTHTPLVHIDADLYSSAIFVLCELHRHFSEYYVMFDEFGAGEGRALRDFKSAYGIQFDPIMGCKRKSSCSKLFRQVFGKITH